MLTSNELNALSKILFQVCATKAPILIATLDCIYTMPVYYENDEKCDVSKFELAFTRYRHNLKTIENSTITNSRQSLSSVSHDAFPKCAG